ncbi:MAG: hypothetical protein ACKO0Z_19495 [Betaproteobacteria bacterium]
MTTSTATRNKALSRRTHKVNAMSFSILCRLLMEGTRTCQELAHDTGLHVLTIYDWTRTMHRHGVIHVCMWEGEGRASQRIFKLGFGLDAPRPMKSRTQSQIDYRAKKRAKALLQRMAGKLEGAHA